MSLSPSSEHPVPRRVSGRRVAVLAAAVLGAASLCVVVGLSSRATAGAGGAASAASTPDTLSEASRATVPAAIERQLATGWVGYNGGFALLPELRDSSPKGYLRVGEWSSEPGRAAVYDRPEGKVVGYAYAQLGFVPLADDPGFDAHRTRVERFGCDQFHDDCRLTPPGLERPAS